MIRSPVLSVLITLCAGVLTACGQAPAPSAAPAPVAANSATVPSAPAPALPSVETSKEMAQPRWSVEDIRDEMTDEIHRIAFYSDSKDDLSFEAEYYCPGPREPARFRVTTQGGYLLTEPGENGKTVSLPRWDPGTGAVIQMVLFESDSFRNVYDGAAPILDDPRKFKLELQFTDGTRFVLRADDALASYLQPCASSGE